METARVDGVARWAPNRTALSAALADVAERLRGPPTRRCCLRGHDSDFERAIRYGSTCVRCRAALLGEPGVSLALKR